MFREVERFREVEKVERDLILRNYFKQTRKDDDFDPDKRIIVKEEKS